MFVPLILQACAEKYAYRDNLIPSCISLSDAFEADIAQCEKGVECPLKNPFTDETGATVRLVMATCRQCVIGNGGRLWDAVSQTFVEEKVDLRVSFLGFEFSPFSFASGVISISVFFQALSFVTLSPLADYGNARLNALRFTGICGGVCACLFMAVSSPEQYELAALLTIIVQVLFGLSIVFYNAFLVVIVEASPEILNAVPLRSTPDDLDKFRDQEVGE